MSFIDDIKTVIGNLLPDNSSQSISAEDARLSFDAILDNLSIIGSNYYGTVITTSAAISGAEEGATVIPTEDGVYTNFSNRERNGNFIVFVYNGVDWDGVEIHRKSGIVPSLNLFDKRTIVDGFFLSAGTPVANPAFFISDYIPCKPSTLYSNNNTNQVEYYDKDKVYISGVNAVTSFTTFAGSAFIRISSQTSSVSPEEVMVSIGASLPAIYTPYNYTFDRDVVLGDDSISVEKTTFISKTVNLFNKETIVDGFFLLGGVLTPNAGFFTSDFIPCEPSTLYSNNNTNQVEWYTSNKSYIAGVNGVTSFTTAANAEFIRVASQTSARPPEVIMVVLASLPVKYVPYAYKLDRNLELNENTVNDIQASFIEATLNLFDKRTIVDGFFLSGGTLSPNAAFFTSDYIPCEPSTLYSNNNTNQVEFYDLSKTYISGLNGVSSFTTPSGAVYIRIASQTSAIAPYEVMLSIGASLPEFYKPYSYNHDRDLNTEFKYSGLKFTSFGDSITELNGWQPNVIGATDLIHTIRGIGSSAFAEIGLIAWVDADGLLLSRPPAAPPAGTEGIDYFEILTSMSNDERIDTIPLDTQFLTIMGGTNDYGNDIPLGTTGVLTNTTFKGSASMIIEKILTLMPNVRILMITPPSFSTFATNTEGLMMRDYADAVIEVAQYYGMPYLDMFSGCGWNPINHTEYLADGTHPNKAGWLRMSNLILGKLFEMKPIYKSEIV